ncbi:hypothetical protein ACFE04_024868 [Oxalis oulophora]
MTSSSSSTSTNSSNDDVIIKWRHSIIYLSLINSLIFLIHNTEISHKLQLSTPPPPHDDVVHIKKSPLLPLRFRYDGTFKILQVGDRKGDVAVAYFNLLLFLATGDNIFGSSAADAAESLLKAFRPVIESGIPWAVVLGNHDQESSMDRQELMSFISTIDYSISQINPTAKDSSIITNIDGFGNYNLRVYGAPGSHLANISILNLYFLDSGDREVVNGKRTYGWIKESQLKWLHDVSEGQNTYSTCTKDSLPSTKPPAMAFFHIPIPEIWQLYNHKIIGQFQEAIACSSVNSGVLQSFVSMGDVKAVFMGHDHKNDFCGNLNGIWFCYGGGFGYHAYGKTGWSRRARVISVNLQKGSNTWMGVESIRTWKRLDDNWLSKIDEQLLWSLK